MSTGVAGVWAMRPGDFLAREFPGTSPGIQDAVTYAGSNGTVQVFPGNSSLVIPTVPAEVLLIKHEAGAQYVYGDTYFRGRPWYDVRAFGAKGDGVTDDTSAIQAAINAAGPVYGAVYLPGAGELLPYMFSNLTIYAKMKFFGQSGGVQTVLKRIAGSTGTAIKEKTAAQGNADGATGLEVRDLWVDGNSTTGDGLDLGNSGGPQLNTSSLIENIHVRNFTSGTGIKLNQNAAHARNLWSILNQTGIALSGGASTYVGLWAEGNTNVNLDLSGNNDNLFGVHIENTTNDPTINCVRFNDTADQCSVYGITITLNQNATNDLIWIHGGADRNALYQVTVIGAGSYTYPNVVNDSGPSVASGGSTDGIYYLPFWIDVSDQRSFIYDGRATTPVPVGAARGLAAAGVSADRGDTSPTLTVAGDAPTQRFATALTANRTITLSTTGVFNGARFRIVRTGLGAFTLDVGGLKTVPSATAAFVDVEYDGSSWRLVGYGTL